MDIINLTNGVFFSCHKVRSFVLRLIHNKDVWLFNCCEGCQHDLIQHRVKLSQISTVILTDLNTDSLSGLIGLLSSLSLINRKRLLHLYGPPSLDKYINLLKKYSKTNFCYRLYLHVLRTGLLAKFDDYLIYTFVKKNKLSLLLLIEKKMELFNYSRLKCLI